MVSLSTGKRHSCALLAEGSVQCWGSNNSGALGNGSIAVSSATPVTVDGLSSVVSVSAGGYHSCAVLASGNVRCWGSNMDGELGNGTTVSSDNPVTVSSLSTAISVTTGENHSCAVLENGSVQCWGYNGDDQWFLQRWASPDLPVMVSE